MKIKLITIFVLITMLLAGCGQKQNDVEKVTLKDGRYIEAENSIFDFAIDDEYLYYQGQQGEIFKRPLSDLKDDAQRRCVAQVPYEDMYYVGYPFANIYEQNGSVFYRYHSGGASMGGDYQYRIDDAESKLIINRSYDTYIAFKDFDVQVAGARIGGKPPVPINKILPDGTVEALGEEGYCFNTQQDAYDVNRNVLYVSASKYTNGWGSPIGEPYIYAIDLADNTTTKLSHNTSFIFSVSDDAIYYLSCVDANGAIADNYNYPYLYQLDLETGEEQYIAEIGISELWDGYNYATVDKGVLYAGTEKENGLCLWNKQTKETMLLNEGAKVTKLYRQNDYVIAHFEENAKNLPQTVIFYEDCEHVYAIADPVDKVVINENGVMLYRLSGTSQLMKVQL